MIYDVCALGEILIDAIAEADSEVHITGNAGGAPANVLACATKLGRSCAFISKAGDDYIGRWLKKIIDENAINTDGLILSPSKNTAIAMVSLSADGNRSFSFYRSGCADTSLERSELRLDIIKNSRMFHFGSVSLTEEPSRSSTLYAAQYAREHNVIVSYDPNLRLNLWHSSEEAINYIKTGLTLCDIAKFSDEEVYFLYGNGDITEKARLIFADAPHLKILLITCGAQGSYAFCGDVKAYAPSFSVKVVDTTGAGDCFVGASLSWIFNHKLCLGGYTSDELTDLLIYGNTVASLSIQKHGAIAAMPSLEEISAFQAGRLN